MKPMGEGGIVLTDCRHPVLEVWATETEIKWAFFFWLTVCICWQAQPDMQFVSNDIEITRDKSQFVIITGPNMGGKSVRPLTD